MNYPQPLETASTKTNDTCGKLSSAQYNNSKYDRIRVLGKGSFGTAIVYRRKVDCALVVLKEIQLQRFRSERERELAFNEAKIMSNLSHANIIKYFNAYTTDTKLIIEMEYASIGTLNSYLSLYGQPLEEREILVIFRQVTSGLSYLHSKSIVHLDLKMTNIFVTNDGQVKIGDFGIAQFIRQDSRDLSSGDQNNKARTTSGLNPISNHQTNSHLGTLAYSSPECCLGQATDYKSDIWSLGCILYELITSRPLFNGDSLPELVLSITRVHYQPIKRKISPILRETFQLMINRDPSIRPSALNLLSIIDQMLNRIQFHWLQSNSSKRRQPRHFDLSTDFVASDTSRINYPRSLVYQIRLDSPTIEVDRVNLPQSKRIKEISKGKSHYLVLTYDNIVYGWGSKRFGQLGACNLNHLLVSSRESSSTSKNRLRFCRSARNSVNAKDLQCQYDELVQKSMISSTPTSLASSTQTIVESGSFSSMPNIKLNKQMIMSQLEGSLPASRPFVISELNHRRIIQVAAGNNFSVFLSKTGIVMTCGDGSTGCLGRGDVSSCFMPCMVDYLLNMDVVSIACGPKHVVAVCGNGRVFSWGKSSNGRLGVLLDSHETKYIARPKLVHFPSSVCIKNAICGDRCTIFVDSSNKCWATGENRFNKLGLDIKRRFKKTLIIDQSWTPTEIAALSKYNIATCSIGKNHSTFITSDGKLLVFGQNIDFGYRFRRNIVESRQSYRRISFELRQPTKQRLVGPFKPTNMGSKRLIGHVDNSNTQNENNVSYRDLKLYLQGRTTLQCKLHERQLSKLQRQQIESYIRKSRASRKMSFECVTSVNCRPGFTLALTNDNRVYFWGTRLYKKHPEGTFLVQASSAKRRRRGHRLKQSSVEPQLVASCSDDCFIKIGPTNCSLMDTIQTLGSDQPIIHAQDPRLVARSLADLWILDYRPSPTNSLSSSSSSSSSSTCSSSSRLSTYSYSTSLSCSSSCSSRCSLCTKDSLSRSSSSSSISNFNNKYDAILEPQPILSLYVPSMFNNQNGCMLQLADLFCFDDNRFYLVLDTTLKLATSQTQTERNSLSAPRTKRMNSLTEDVILTSRTQNTSLNQQQQTATLQPRVISSVSTERHQQHIETRDSSIPLEELEHNVEQHQTCGPSRSASCVSANEAGLLNGVESHGDGNVENVNENNDCSKYSDCNDCNDCNNNEGDDDGDSAATNDRLELARPSSSHGASLEEPRSFSTFAGHMGNHIVIGPTLRSADQHLKPLRFHGKENGSSRFSEPDISSSASSQSQESEIERCKSRWKHRRPRFTSKWSESIGNDETSSMPSWVKNEYIEYQRAEDQANHAPGSSQTITDYDDEATCTSEISISSASDVGSNPNQRSLSEPIDDDDDDAGSMLTFVPTEANSQREASSRSPSSSSSSSSSSNCTTLARSPAQPTAGSRPVRQAARLVRVTRLSCSEPDVSKSAFSTSQADGLELSSRCASVQYDSLCKNGEPAATYENPAQAASKSTSSGNEMRQNLVVSIYPSNSTSQIALTDTKSDFSSESRVALASQAQDQHLNRSASQAIGVRSGPIWSNPNNRLKASLALSKSISFDSSKMRRQTRSSSMSSLRRSLVRLFC